MQAGPTKMIDHQHEPRRPAGRLFVDVGEHGSWDDDPRQDEVVGLGAGESDVGSIQEADDTVGNQARQLRRRTDQAENQDRAARRKLFERLAQDHRQRGSLRLLVAVDHPDRARGQQREEHPKEPARENGKIHPTLRRIGGQASSFRSRHLRCQLAQAVKEGRRIDVVRIDLIPPSGLRCVLRIAGSERGFAGPGRRSQPGDGLDGRECREQAPAREHIPKAGTGGLASRGASHFTTAFDITSGNSRARPGGFSRSEVRTGRGQRTATGVRRPGDLRFVSDP